MRHNVIKLGHWVIDFLFAKLDYDEEGVLGCLYDMDADKRILRRASEIMNNDRLNCGFTFSNPDLHRALVVIGPTSSGKQFCNTISHEIYHLATAIADDLGIDLKSETPAYIAGDATMALIESICEFGCSHCKN